MVSTIYLSKIFQKKLKKPLKRLIKNLLLFPTNKFAVFNKKKSRIFSENEKIRDDLCLFIKPKINSI